MLHGQINEKNVSLQFSDNSLSHFNLPLTFSTTSLWSFPRIYEHTVTDVHPSEQHVWSPNTQEYGGHPLVCRCSVVTVRIITILCIVPLKLQCWVAEAYFLYKSSSPRASYEKNARKVKWGSQSVHHKSRSSTCAWTSAAECTKPFQTQAELLHDFEGACVCLLWRWGIYHGRVANYRWWKSGKSETSPLKLNSPWLSWNRWLNFALWYIIYAIWCNKTDQRMDINRGVKGNLNCYCTHAKACHFGIWTVR